MTKEEYHKIIDRFTASECTFEYGYRRKGSGEMLNYDT